MLAVLFLKMSCSYPSPNLCRHTDSIWCRVEVGTGHVLLSEQKNAPQTQICPKTFVCDCMPFHRFPSSLLQCIGWNDSMTNMASWVYNPSKGKLTYLIQAHTSSPSLSSGTLITLSIKENLAWDEQNLSEHSRVRPPWGALDWLKPQFRFEPQTKKFEDH